MDIIALLKAERDKAAQQVNALDTAIKALSGMNSTHVSHGPHKMSAAARARISASQKARWARTRGKVVSIAPPASHLGSGSSADSTSKSGEMGKVEAAKLMISGPSICPCCGHSDLF